MRGTRGRKLFHRQDRFKDLKERLFTIETIWWKGWDQGTIEFIEDEKDEVIKIPAAELRSLFEDKKLEFI